MTILARGYPLVPLCDVARPVTRPIAVVPSEQYRTIGVKWWGEGAYERETIDGSRTAAKTLSLVREGDLIINKIWVRHGSAAVASVAVDGCAGSGEFPTFELDRTRALPRWLHWLTKTPTFWSWCDALSRGTSGKNRIRPQLFLTIQVPLPPLAEQRRIVARIEALAERIEAVRRLRLEADAEAQAPIGAAAAQHFGRSGDKSSASVGEIAEVRSGIQKGPHRQAHANPVRYLTVAHVQRNLILLTDPRFFEVTPVELNRWRLLPGDVLIIEGNGSADQIGRTALFRGEIPECVHQNHEIRVRPDPCRVTGEYLNLYLNSPVGQDEVQARSRSTSGLRTLSTGRIKEIHVPLLPLPEQRRIVAYLNRLQEKVDGLKRLQAETGAELAALLPAVLDRAFRGEL